MLSVHNKVLHLIDTLWLGGAQRVVKGLFENNTQQNKIFLLALRQTEDMFHIGHPQVFIAKGKGKWDFRTPLKEALQLIAEHDIQSLHCHLPKSQLTGYLIKRFYYPEMKLVFHEQGDIMDPVPFNLPGYFVARKYIDQVICCSRAVEHALVKRARFPKQITRVIYNFVDTQAFPPRPKTTSEEEFHIGFAGRITKRKGWRDFLGAAAILASHSDLKFHVAGTGPEQDQLKAAILEQGLESRVHLHEFVEDMHGFYSNLDLLCVPSHWEPVGMVYLEAMSCGVPVIASNVPGLNEVLKHEENALLFPAKTPQEIAVAVLRVKNDQTLHKYLREEGRKTANRYDYLHHENEINRLYDDFKI